MANSLAGHTKKSNRARRYVNFTPLVGHNIQNCDLYHICLALNNCDSTTTLKVIPSTDEKYISMTFGVLIDTITTQEGRTQKNLRVFNIQRFAQNDEQFAGKTGRNFA